MGESGYSREKRLVIGQMRMMERERETERGLMGGNMNVIENQNWEKLVGVKARLVSKRDRGIKRSHVTGTFGTLDLLGFCRLDRVKFKG